MRAKSWKIGKFSWFLCYKQYRILALEIKTFEKILFQCLRKHFLSILFTKNKRFKKDFWKVKSCEPKKSKIEKFHGFYVTNSTEFSPWRWKLSKKSCSHVSESLFYQFYSLKTKIKRKFWESEKMRAEKVEKVEKSEIFFILSHEKVPIFYFKHENFWENLVCMSQKTLFLWPNY